MMDKTSNVSECKKCDVTYFESVSFNEDRIIEFLIKHCVIKGLTNCESCGRSCILNRQTFKFRCNKKIVKGNKKKTTCRFRRSARVGTFFHCMKLPFDVYFKLLAVLLHTGPPRHRFIRRELNVASATIVYFFSFCRRVFMDHIITNSSILGGPKTVVEIIVAKIASNENVYPKLKEKGDNSCLRDIKGKWVFGGIQHDNRNCFLVPVESCDAHTLMRVLTDWVSPGTTVVSDCWKTYNCFSLKSFRHLKENDILFFEDNITNEYSESLEQCWHEVRGYKSRIGLLKRQKVHTVGYLAEFQFKWKYPKHAQRFHHFFHSAAAMLPPKY